MQGEKTVLDETFTMATTTGAVLNAAVVPDAADGSCKLPAAQNAAQFLGFLHETPKATKGASVRTMGAHQAIAAGAIAYGDAVRIADGTGKVESCETLVNAAPGSAAQVNVIGRARSTASNPGDLVLVKIDPQVVKTAAS